MKKKVLIVNQGKSDNIGDKAIAVALENFFKELEYEVDIAGYTQFEYVNINEVSTADYVAVRQFDIPIWIKWLLRKKWQLRREMNNYKKKYDILVLGGGQLIKSNCYFPFAFREWSRFGKKYAKKMYVIGVGVDNNIKRLEKFMYKNSFKKFDNVIVRDYKSQKILKNKFKIDSIWAPDTAFLLNSDLKRKVNSNGKYALIMIYDYNTYKIHFKNEKTYDDYLDEWKMIVDKEIKKNNKIVLAYTTIEDKRQSIDFINILGENYSDFVKVAEIKNLQDFINLLQECNKIYSARMHALILAMMLKKEVICIKVSDKLANFEKDYIKSKINVDDAELLIKNAMNEIFMIGENLW